MVRHQSDVGHYVIIKMILVPDVEKYHHSGDLVEHKLEEFSFLGYNVR
jgi:hypothetical protein